MDVTSIIAFFTVTVQVALLPSAEAVIVAVPSLMAVTIPLFETVAMAELELVHEIVLSVASDGDTVATSVAVSPSSIDKDVWDSVMLSTAMTFFRIVTVHWALTLPAVAEISAVPSLSAVIKPVSETLATAASELLQTTALSVALAGYTVAVSVAVSPSTSANAFSDSVIEVTSITSSATVTVQVARWLPTVAVIVVVPLAFALTKPLEETVATVVLELAHRTVLSVAFAGITVTVRISSSPTFMLSVLLDKVTPVTLMTGSSFSPSVPQATSSSTIKRISENLVNSFFILSLFWCYKI